MAQVTSTALIAFTPEENTETTGIAFAVIFFLISFLMHGYVSLPQAAAPLT